MTGTIDDAAPFTGGVEPHRGTWGLTAAPAPAALIEQAKGVLIFRYGIAAAAAYSLLELWAAQTDATIGELAQAIVHDICQGDRSLPSDPVLVRWLEERLRHEFPGLASDSPPPRTVGG